jgi:hypothetical protein
VRQKLHGHAIQELLLRAHLLGHMARLPALEVDAAHDQRQLCAEIDRLLDGETVPQLMQDGPQHAVGLVLIGKIAVVA